MKELTKLVYGGAIIFILFKIVSCTNGIGKSYQCNFNENKSACEYVERELGNVTGNK